MAELGRANVRVPAGPVRRDPLQRRATSEASRDETRAARPTAVAPSSQVNRWARPQLAAMLSEPATPANRTGLPDRLKSGVEALSGLSLDDVTVHATSAEPAKLGAAAFAKGSDIYLAAGQERHLPHEAWHVVQQQQGRVRPTLQAKGVGINDDRSLEREADVMGARALPAARETAVEAPLPARERPREQAPVVQRRLDAMVWNSKKIKLSPEETKTLVEAVGVLNRMGRAINAEVGVIIELENPQDAPDTNPASTTKKSAGKIKVKAKPVDKAKVDEKASEDQQHIAEPSVEAWDVTVTLQKWLIQVSTVGELVGMIAHELGVHSLADIEMGEKALEVETTAMDKPFVVDTGEKSFTLPASKGGDRRQQDHVNVAKIRKDGQSARMDRYVDTMLRLGDAMEPEQSTPAAEKAALTRRKDLLETFLFDIARIVATDDGKAWKIAWKIRDVAAVFNWYQNVLIGKHQGAHKWLVAAKRGVPNSATQLLKWLAWKVTQVAYRERGPIARAVWGGVKGAAGWAAGKVSGTVGAAAGLVKGAVGGTIGAAGWVAGKVKSFF